MTDTSSSPNSLSSPAPCSLSSTDESPPTSSQSHTQLVHPSPKLLGTYPIQTRAKNGIFKPKHAYSTIKYPLPASIEPSTVSQALKSPQWHQAMVTKFNALMTNRAWDLVPNHSNFNVIGNRWIFRIKRNPDGTISRYKAQLIAKGYHQRLGINFSSTFSPVIKPQTIKVVLTIALSLGWALRQMDINKAFLHGNLTEEVYMHQPSGFVHPQFPNHVCKLKKAIYGLKQAPRAWYNSLRDFLLSYGFINSKTDTSLFIYNTGGILAYFLVYVDDLLFTGNNSPFL